MLSRLSTAISNYTYMHVKWGPGRWPDIQLQDGLLLLSIFHPARRLCNLSLFLSLLSPLSLSLSSSLPLPPARPYQGPEEPSVGGLCGFVWMSATQVTLVTILILYSYPHTVFLCQLSMSTFTCLCLTLHFYINKIFVIIIMSIFTKPLVSINICLITTWANAITFCTCN